MRARSELVTGSSPLTRGKRFVLTSRFCLVGLIPAHAGKTSKDPPTLVKPRAHPRSRGENTNVRKGLNALAGSSPLTRGKLAVLLLPRSRQRLIPAHAGKTIAARSKGSGRGAHPRSRGENVRRPADARNAGGSSPLTRGKPPPTMRRALQIGLIPAHAGKTQRTSPFRPSRTAHPRSRGENALMMRSVLLIQGSSPLTRGKLGEELTVKRGQGLIPAHAGKTSHGRPPGHRFRAHPRSRGENASQVRRWLEAKGSSPLTRGKPRRSSPHAQRRGLIPAHAGKTGPRTQRHLGGPAHPRSRGENIQTTVQTVAGWGSSPLTRGKLHALLDDATQEGLIPAHAGKTLPRDSLQRSRRAHPRSRGENAPTTTRER